MKIGLCISGSFRGSAATIGQNLWNLRKAGHEVITYAFLQPEVNFLRVNWDIRRLPVIGYARPWVSYYDFSDFHVQGIAELAAKESWNFKDMGMANKKLPRAAALI